MSTVAPEHVSELTAMMYPGYTRRCGHCAGYVAVSAEEAVRQMAEATYQPYIALAKALQDQGMGATTGLPTDTRPGWGDWGLWSRTGTGHHGYGHRGHGSKHEHHGHDHGYGRDCGCGGDGDCGCKSCVRDDCSCQCCVVNADLVVNARLGERRVVPVSLENNRRREREITLELSSFTSKGGRESAVTGRLLPPDRFTLGPCEQREVVVLIQVAGEGDDGGPGEPRGEGEDKGKDDDTGRRVPDVDECEVAYADLRIVGCDNRPIRIAVATLPRDCHSYRVDCACGCC